MGSSNVKKDKKLSEVLTFLEKNYNLNQVDVLALIKEQEKKKQIANSQYLPCSILQNTTLSPLEAITIFFRDKKQWTFVDMQHLLGRDQRALSTTYRNAKKKHATEFTIKPTKFYFPCHLLANRHLSVLEHLVNYLKIEYKLSNTKIAQLLNRDSRTIWTVLHRIKKKRREK
jgi:hypothetical protein